MTLRFIICQNGLKATFTLSKRQKRFKKMEIQNWYRWWYFLSSLTYWVMVTKLEVRQKIRLFFTKFVGHSYESRNLWFCKSFANILHYTTYIWTAQFFSHRLYCRSCVLPLLLRARSFLHAHLFENVLMISRNEYIHNRGSFILR